MDSLAALTAKFHRVWPLLDERTRRLMAARDAIAVGSGGVSVVSRAGGLSRRAIANGIREIEAGAAWPAGRVRRPGAGRQPIRVSDPARGGTLAAWIVDDTRGAPESPRRWTCKSTRSLAHAMTRRHHPVGHVQVAQLLHGLDDSLQRHRKTEEGRAPPDRDAQCRHINAGVKRRLADGSPVISVDTKQKERIGH